MVLLVVWLMGNGTDTVAPLPRTVAFAVLLLVLHECAVLTSAVPASAYATAAVMRHWLIHLAPEALAVALAAAAVAVTGRLAGSTGGDIAGLAAVLVVLVALGWFARSASRRASHGRHRGW
jgi:hypothetical protein